MQCSSPSNLITNMLRATECNLSAARSRKTHTYSRSTEHAFFPFVCVTTKPFSHFLVSFLERAKCVTSRAEILVLDQY